jgi:hypothetical protein
MDFRSRIGLIVIARPLDYQQSRHDTVERGVILGAFNARKVTAAGTLEIQISSLRDTA